MPHTEDFDVAAFKSDMAKATEAIQGCIPGALVTLIVRYPGHEEGFLVAGADDLDAVADVIRRAKRQKQS